MTQLYYPTNVCQSMCSRGVCLWCTYRCYYFPIVSWYQLSENSKSHGTFFLLPYGNKCHVFFLVSLIALSALQFSKYLPLCAESLLYGQVFPGTCDSVLSTANPRACGGLFAKWWGAKHGGRADGTGVSPSPQARPGGSSQVEPRLQIPRQVHGDEATSETSG